MPPFPAHDRPWQATRGHRDRRGAEIGGLCVGDCLLGGKATAAGESLCDRQDREGRDYEIAVGERWPRAQLRRILGSCEAPSPCAFLV